MQSVTSIDVSGWCTFHTLSNCYVILLGVIIIIEKFFVGKLSTYQRLSLQPFLESSQDLPHTPSGNNYDVYHEF